MTIMNCERINDWNRNQINEFIRQQWYTTTMIIRGKEIDMTKTEGFYVDRKSTRLNSSHS